ncbi:MAG: Spy/CpxP family protein refolding chaperone [Candidatus Acidiferrales bacterium]
MKARILIFSAACLLAALAASAQPAPPPQHDPIGEFLFPPELVMAHQSEIGLASEQKTTLRRELSQTQAQFTEMQWELQDAMEALRAQLEPQQVNAERVRAQLDQVLEIENRIKRLQLSLMVRIKNSLTPEQQARLRELRPRAPTPPPGPSRPPAPQPDLD